MGKSKNAIQNTSVNWLQFFQVLNSTYGRIALIVSLITLGYAAGNYLSDLKKSRELLQMQRELNELSAEKDKLMIECESDRSEAKLELYKRADIIKQLNDSIKNGTK